MMQQFHHVTRLRILPLTALNGPPFLFFFSKGGGAASGKGRGGVGIIRDGSLPPLFLFLKSKSTFCDKSWFSLYLLVPWLISCCFKDLQQVAEGGQKRRSRQLGRDDILAGRQAPY